MFQRKVSFLGHIVSSDGVQCDPAKVLAVRDWETPVSVADVRSFLGLASYYRRFVESFSTIASLLYDLLCKNQKFKWSGACQQAFDILRERLTTAPILAYPRGGDNFILTQMQEHLGLARFSLKSKMDKRRLSPMPVKL